MWYHWFIRQGFLDLKYSVSFCVYNICGINQRQKHRMISVWPVFFGNSLPIFTPKNRKLSNQAGVLEMLFSCFRCCLKYPPHVTTEVWVRRLWRWGFLWKRFKDWISNMCSKTVFPVVGSFTVDIYVGEYHGDSVFQGPLGMIAMHTTKSKGCLRYEHGWTWHQPVLTTITQHLLRIFVYHFWEQI